MLRMPAIEVRDHRDRGVADLRFARQLRLRQVGHADNFESQLPVYQRFRKCRELRPFDADIRPAAMHLHAFVDAGIREHARQRSAGRMREGDMRDETIPEKGGGAILGSIKKLIGNEKFPWLQVFFQRTDRAHGDDALHAQELHGVNVRAVIDLARQDAMPAAVARQKCHALSFQRAKHDSIRGIAERRSNANLARVRQSAHRIEPAPSDDADRRLGIGFGTLRLPGLLCRHIFYPRIQMKVSFVQMPCFPAVQIQAPFLQPSRPLFLSISFTAENGSFFRSATSAASSAKRASPPAPPSARSSKRDSSSSISRFFQCSTCFPRRWPLDSKCFRNFATVSDNSSMPLFSDATARTTGGCQPSRGITSDSMASNCCSSRSAPSRSALFTTKMSPISMSPAFMF